MQNVFVQEERAFQTVLTAKKSGFCRICVQYEHTNWDAWARLDVVSGSGEVRTYFPPMPKKDTQTTMLVWLFAGENRITFAPRFDQPVTIHAVKLVDEAPVLQPRVTPSCDYLDLSSPRVRRLTVESYTGAPLKITENGEEIDFECEDKALYDHENPVETKEPETYYHLKLYPDALSKMTEGVHTLLIHLPMGERVSYTLNVERKRKEYAFSIVSLDVNHGNCTLLRLPNGKNLLIDTGTARCANDVIFPYLEEEGIAPDYCLITHDHSDHTGSLEAVLSRYPLSKADSRKTEEYIAAGDTAAREAYLSDFGYLDTTLLCRGDRLDRIWDLGGVEITVLNSKYEKDGREAAPGSLDENNKSVSMLIRYKGFGYYHGADNYAPIQQRNLDDFTAAGCLGALSCQYMLANHHFHGDMLPEMIRAVNPVAVTVPANQAIFSRSAYMVDYLQRVVQTDYPEKRLKDTLISYTSGTVWVSVNSGDDWRYETR